MEQFSDVILQHISALLPSENKVTQVAIATLVLNYTVASTADTTTHSRQGECLTLVSLLLDGLSDPEAKFRTLVALGTLLDAGAEGNREVAKTLELAERVRTCQMLHGQGEKLFNVSKHILTLMT